jgi:hypothetical protein
MGVGPDGICCMLGTLSGQDPGIRVQLCGTPPPAPLTLSAAAVVPLSGFTELSFHNLNLVGGRVRMLARGRGYQLGGQRCAAVDEAMVRLK